MVDGEPVRKLPSLKAQWGVLAVFLIPSMAAGTVSVLDDLGNRQGVGPFGCIAGLFVALAQATWVTMDSKRLGRPIGWFRFAVICFGPLGMWAYRLTAYKNRALLWIPVSILVYGSLLFGPVLLAYLIRPELF